MCGWGGGGGERVGRVCVLGGGEGRVGHVCVCVGRAGGREKG